MELSQKWLAKARSRQTDFLDAGSQYALTAAIETYLAEMFKPGQMMTREPLEAIPQRDYRKELWIAHWAAIDGETKFEDAVYGTQKAVEAFDKFFSEPTHG